MTHKGDYEEVACLRDDEEGRRTRQRRDYDKKPAGWLENAPLQRRIAALIGVGVVVLLTFAMFSGGSSEGSLGPLSYMQGRGGGEGGGPAQVHASVGGGFYISNPPAAVANDTATLVSANSVFNIVEFARHVKRDEDSFVTVTFASYSYRDALINWLIAAERVNVRSVVVVCLDTALQDYLFVRGIPCFHAYASESESESENINPIEDNSEAYDAEADTAEDGTGGDRRRALMDDEDGDFDEMQEYEESKADDAAVDFIEGEGEAAVELDKAKIHKLWIMRVNYLSELLHSGIDVLFSDLDAVIMRDPRPYFAKAEIVASRGKFPAHASHAWGSSVCMGFAFFKSTPNVKVILEDMIELLQRHSDDQIAVNDALLHRLGRKPETVFGRRISIWEDDHAISQVSGGHGQPKLFLLSHFAIPRFCTKLFQADWNADILAAHCRGPKHTGVDAREYARDLALARFDLFCDTDALAGDRIATFKDRPGKGSKRHRKRYTNPTPESMLIAAETPADHVKFSAWLENAARTCDFGSFISIPSKRNLVLA